MRIAAGLVLLTLAGCSPSDGAAKAEAARECPQDEFRAYCDSFNPKFHG